MITMFIDKLKDTLVLLMSPKQGRPSSQMPAIPPPLSTFLLLRRLPRGRRKAAGADYPPKVEPWAEPLTPSGAGGASSTPVGARGFDLLVEAREDVESSSLLSPL